ncbi:MAG TPA: demethoxyubiquinone hydroxylase family protein [Alphaproteobacteria bacterium]|nr:demethoxyubiquinone hydroxylase family protein [Alphaproteobacteria bacterium]
MSEATPKSDHESDPKPAPRARVWPGDPDSREAVARMIRVDHAGEYGAKRIYAGQLAVLGKSAAGAIVKKMADQEERHLAAFDKLIVERRVRPTAMHPIWHVAGFALGAATALLGPRAAMACTVAVEEVIDEHYGRQLAALDGMGAREAALKETVAEFRADEVEHKEIGLAEGAEATPGYPVLVGAIKAASKLAIWISTRV